MTKDLLSAIIEDEIVSINLEKKYDNEWRYYR